MTNQVQTNNKAFITGVLKKKEIEIKPSKSSGKLMASGYLTLVVDTPVGKGEVKVRVQQFAEKKDGGANSLYKALQTIKEQYKSIEEVGEENADTIKIEGELVDNTYYSTKKEEFVEYLELKGTFINRVEASTPHCCKVAFEGYISKITPINDELEVEIIGLGYEGVAVPVKGIIPQHLVAAFQGRYTVGCTTTLNIAIINQVETTVLQEEVVFGESIGEVIEKTTAKRIIFGGGKIEYGRISQETIQKALTIRESKLEDKKQSALKNNNQSTMNTGFAAVGGMNTNLGQETVAFGVGGVGFGAPVGGGFPGV